VACGAQNRRNCHRPTCQNWTKTLWRPFQHFHTHAGAKDVSSAPGAWLQLRDALDYADVSRPFPSWNRSILTEIYLCHACSCQEILKTETAGQATRFPAAQFGGPVERSNTARLQKIVAAFAGLGAVVEDVAAASASRHQSRNRKGINSIGWRIWPHNCERAASHPPQRVC
jgi:hypothetical protein